VAQNSVDSLNEEVPENISNYQAEQQSKYTLPFVQMVIPSATISEHRRSHEHSNVVDISYQ
jgi:hypothetical protein